VEDEFFQIGSAELFEMILEIGAGRLRSGSNRISIILIIVTAWAGFKEMGAIFVNSGNK
jgi:hypothetical protein